MGQIQNAITGSLAAVAGASVAAKAIKEQEASKKEREEAKKQSVAKAERAEARTQEKHDLEVKGLKAENRTKRLQARTAKIELELARAKARDSLEVARLQKEPKKVVSSDMKKRLATLRKGVK